MPVPFLPKSHLSSASRAYASEYRLAASLVSRPSIRYPNLPWYRMDCVGESRRPVECKRIKDLLEQDFCQVQHDDAHAGGCSEARFGG